MNPPSPLVKVSMIREHLDGIPQFPLPPGFSIRSYHPGDALAWTQIWGEADQFQAAPAGFFEHQFGSDEARLRERQLFLCDSQGEPIGTATAWFKPGGRRPFTGRVHYVAIVPRFQGQGLGKPLLTATCNRLIELQHRRACLSTETVRRAAIHLYLKFGFLPEIRNRHDRLAWRDLQQQGLAIPAQATLPRSALD